MTKELSLEDMMKEDAGQGFENYDPSEEGSGLRFVKLLQPLSPEVADGDYKPGTIYSKGVLALPETEVDIIPLYYFRDWSVWNEENKCVKRSQKKEYFTEAELAWGKDGKKYIPPIAQEALNFVITLAADPTLTYILSFAKTNFEAGSKFRTLVADKTSTESIPMYGGIYTLKSQKTTDGKNSWWTFASPKFKGKVTDITQYKAVKGFYGEIFSMNLNKVLSIGVGESASKLEAPKQPIEVEAKIDPNAEY